MAFSKWDEYTQQRVEYKHLGRRAVGAMRSQGILRALSTWSEFVRAAARSTKMLKRGLLSMRRHHVRKVSV